MIIEVSTKDDVIKLFSLVKTVETESEFMLHNANERVVSKEVYEQFYNAVLNKSMVGLVYCDKDCFVGYIIGKKRAELKKPHIMSVTMGVRKDYSNKGIGTKLMEKILILLTTRAETTRIELAVHEDNVAAIALYKKFGFETEGVMKKAVLKQGIFINEYLMSKLI